MGRLSILACSAVVGVALLPGCLVIDYKPAVQVEIQPVEKAVAVDGNAGAFAEVSQRMQLPHLTRRERLQLSAENLTSQLGSGDYMLVAVISGHGEDINLEHLRASMCRRAAKEGGEVVLFVSSGTDTDISSYTAPGQATSVYTTFGSTTHGTTHYTSPKTTFFETKKPFASGYVFKHKPGNRAVTDAVLRLEEGQLESVADALAKLWQDPTLTWEAALSREDELLRQEGGLAASAADEAAEVPAEVGANQAEPG